MPSLLQNHRAGFGCPCFLAEEPFFQNERRAPGGKQGLLWPGRSGRLAEPCPLPEMLLRCPSLPRASRGTDPISYVDIWVPVYRLLGLDQVRFPSGVVALVYFCPQRRHWKSCLPPAQQSMWSSLGWRQSLLGFPAPSGIWYKHTPQLSVGFLKQLGPCLAKHAWAVLLWWKWAAKLVKLVSSHFLLQRDSLESSMVWALRFPVVGTCPLWILCCLIRFVLALWPCPQRCCRQAFLFYLAPILMNLVWT